MTNFEKIKESPLELLAVMFARAFVEGLAQGSYEADENNERLDPSPVISKEEITDLLKSPDGYDIISTYVQFLNSEASE